MINPPKFLRIEFDEQFFNKEGKVVREDTYTPELLASGRCDFYPNNLANLPWREKKLNFVALFPERMAVLINKSKKAEFKTPADLCGKVAATYKDSGYHTWLQEQNKSICVANPIHMELTTTEEEDLKAIEEGRVDFTLALVVTAIRFTRHEGKNCVVPFLVGPMRFFGWAFRKEDKDLQEALKKFFDVQRATKDSILNNQWKSYLGMTLIEYIELITYIK
jgi:ABC-type amino acid transport substrate-binding protein